MYSVFARISGLGVALHVERCKAEFKVELKVVRSEKMAKHPFEEYEDVSEVVNPSPNVKIHGVVSLWSLMRQSKNCCIC